MKSKKSYFKRIINNTGFKLLLYVLTYFAAGRLTMNITDTPPGNATFIWPPTGIAVAAVLQWGVAFIPATIVAELAVILSGLNSLTLQSAFSVAMVAVGTGIEVGIITSVLRGVFNYDGSPSRPASLVRLVAGSALGAVVCGILATVSLKIFNPYQVLVEPKTNLLLWASGDFLGVLCIAPFFLTHIDDWNQPVSVRAGISRHLIFGFIAAAFTIAASNGTIEPEMRNYYYVVGFYTALIWAAVSLSSREFYFLLGLFAIGSLSVGGHNYLPILRSVQNPLWEIVSSQLMLGALTLSALLVHSLTMGPVVIAREVSKRRSLIRLVVANHHLGSSHGSKKPRGDRSRLKLIARKESKRSKKAA